MNYTEKLINLYRNVLGHTLRPFWNRERSRIYIFDIEKEEILGSVTNTEYVQLAEYYNLPTDISQNQDVLSKLLEGLDDEEMKVVNNIEY